MNTGKPSRLMPNGLELFDDRGGDRVAVARQVAIFTVAGDSRNARLRSVPVACVLDVEKRRSVGKPGQSIAVDRDCLARERAAEADTLNLDPAVRRARAGCGPEKHRSCHPSGRAVPPEVSELGVKRTWE